MRRGARAALAFLPLAAAACRDELPTTPEQPAVALLGVAADTGNVVSLRVRFAPVTGDSVRVFYTDPAGVERSTPGQPLEAGEASVYGLAPATRYTVRARFYDGAASSTSDSASALTGSLPAAIADARLNLAGAPFTTGVTVVNVNMASGAYLVAFDSLGAIAWYRRLGDAGLGVQAATMQRDGNLTAYVGTGMGFNPAYGMLVELRPSGEVVRSYSAPAPLYTDGHELVLRDEGANGAPSAYFFGYYLRRDTPTRTDGADSVLTYHVILRTTPDGRTQSLFVAENQFGLADRIEPPDLPGLYDVDHPNALDFDTDGGMIVSWRNMGAITKHHPATNAIVWQLGGRKNQFTFVGDPLGGFSAQHSVRVTPQGTLLLFDNGTRHSPSESRAVEYRLDVAARTATMVWQFRHAPAYYNAFQGAVQRLASGNTLVAYSDPGAIVEVAPDGQVVAEARTQLRAGVPINFYRAVRIRSLYGWQAP